MITLPNIDEVFENSSKINVYVMFHFKVFIGISVYTIYIYANIFYWIIVGSHNKLWKPYNHHICFVLIYNLT